MKKLLDKGDETGAGVLRRAEGAFGIRVRLAVWARAGLGLFGFGLGLIGFVFGGGEECNTGVNPWGERACAGFRVLGIGFVLRNAGREWLTIWAGWAVWELGLFCAIELWPQSPQRTQRRILPA